MSIYQFHHLPPICDCHLSDSNTVNLNKAQMINTGKHKVINKTAGRHISSTSSERERGTVMRRTASSELKHQQFQQLLFLLIVLYRAMLRSQADSLPLHVI